MAKSRHYGNFSLGHFERSGEDLFCSARLWLFTGAQLLSHKNTFFNIPLQPVSSTRIQIS